MKYSSNMPQKRETIPYNEATDAGRIIFKGRIADEKVRKRYPDDSVAGFLKEEMPVLSK